MIIASNFKTNHTSTSTLQYVKELSSFLQKEDLKKHQVYVFPPATAFNFFELPHNLKIGAQNAYPVISGSFTGEIGLEQLSEYNIKSIIIGHSERRHILNESNELILKKFEFFKENRFDIIYCIGEPKEIRDKGLDAVIEYNFAQLDGIDLNYERLIVAYEPVWAIGTGVSATLEQIDQTLTSLRKKVKASLLYGGSVKVENTKDILSIKNCDGVLVGTASWDVENFKQMVKIAHEL